MIYQPFGLVCVNFNLVSLFYMNKVSVYAHVTLNVYIKDLKPKCLIDVSEFLYLYPPITRKRRRRYA